jgi:hypothetical protein
VTLTKPRGRLAASLVHDPVGQCLHVGVHFSTVPTGTNDFNYMLKTMC